MASTSRVAAAANGTSTAARTPTAAQQRVLDAYFVHPNAAAVARELGVSERNVRRICREFSGQLDERAKQREDERRESVDARRSKIDDWLDRGLDKTLERLDALAESGNDRVALQAIKLKLEIVMHGLGRAAALFSTDQGFDAMSRDKQRDLAQRLRALDDGEVSATGGDGR